jgi:hypothetical protein
MERQVLIRQKRREGNVMLRGQVLAELPEGKVRVKMEGYSKANPAGIKEISKEDILPGSQNLGPVVNGQRANLVSKQYSRNVNSLSYRYLEK